MTEVGGLNYQQKAPFLDARAPQGARWTIAKSESLLYTARQEKKGRRFICQNWILQLTLHSATGIFRNIFFWG